VKRRSPALLVGLGVLVVVLTGVIAVDLRNHQVAQRAREAHLRIAVETLLPHAAELLEMPAESADLELRSVTAALGVRATLIAPDGHVHADSWTPPGLLDRLGNQSDRPEIVAARAGGLGVAHGRSAESHRATSYVAQAVGPPAHPLGFLRLASEEPARSWPWGGILTALVAAAVGGWLAELWTDRRHAAVVRELAVWSELPATAELEAIAADADRRFRVTREALSRQVDAMQAALERVAEGVVLLDGGGVVRFANQSAAHLLGPALASGRPLIEAVRAPEVLAALHETLTSGETRHTGVAGPDGAELAVRVCALNQPGVAAAVVLRDVREERQLERARQALVADLAHELRTPLTVLSGLAEELTDGGAHPEMSATLTRQVRRLRAFAEELEELTRIESGQLALHPEAADVTAIALHVVEELRVAAESAEVTLAVDGGQVRLRTDQVRLAQVLTNLVDNGIRYNRPGGRVSVRTARVGAEVRIDVEDNGIGIPAEEIAFVFQRFYQVRRQAGREGGSGLGLAIVKHLVRALGGTINLGSQEGRGTTVTLLFPADDRAG
jgi:two-component system phosphate regulon sensor histidine kinase PhoR